MASEWLRKRSGRLSVATVARATSDAAWDCHLRLSVTQCSAHSFRSPFRGISCTAQPSCFLLSLLFTILTLSPPSDFISLLSSPTSLPLSQQLPPLISAPSPSLARILDCISDVLVITKWEVSSLARGQLGHLSRVDLSSLPL